MSEYKQYKRKGASEMRPYVLGEDTTGIGVPSGMIPEIGGMIARDTKNHNDVWYVSKDLFEHTYEEDGSKTLDNTTVSKAKDNVSDLKVYGDGDMFKLLCKASSKNEGWMKSTKAMEIAGLGCVVQVTTQQGDNVSEAVTFVPGVKIEELYSLNGSENKGDVVARKLVKII